MKHLFEQQFIIEDALKDRSAGIINFIITRTALMSKTVAPKLVFCKDGFTVKNVMKTEDFLTGEKSVLIVVDEIKGIQDSYKEPKRFCLQLPVCVFSDDTDHLLSEWVMNNSKAIIKRFESFKNV